MGAPRRSLWYFGVPGRPHEAACFGSPFILGVTPLWYMRALPLPAEEAKRACFLIPGPRVHEIDSANPNEQDSNSHDLAKALRIQTKRTSSCSSLSISNSCYIAEAGLREPERAELHLAGRRHRGADRGQAELFCNAEGAGGFQ